MDLQSLRTQLLDLTRRNRMLYYRENKRFGFDISAGQEWLLNQDFSTEVTISFQQLSAWSKLPVEDTERKIRQTLHEFTTALRERGTHTLFIAFGKCLWKPESTTVGEAPILFLPILCKVTAKAIVITADWEELHWNAALAAVLQQQHNIVLPDITEFSVSTQFSNFVKAIAVLGWDSEPQFSVLSLFNFGSFPQYQDLKEMKPTPALANLLQDVPHFSDSVVPEDFPDKSPLYQDLRVVLDADSSQMRAMARMQQGESFVIQGPPGTGKSQTIVNMIAHAIFNGKRVLFVAEKQAALSVVYQSLARLNLQNFCLNLHSDRTSRSDFFKDLQHTLNLPPVTSKYRFSPDREIREAATKLNSVHELFHTPNRYLMEPRVMLARQASLAKELGSPPKAHISKMADWDNATVQTHHKLIQAYQTLYKTVPPIQNSPFKHLDQTDLDPTQQQELRTCLEALHQSLPAVQPYIAEFYSRIKLRTPMVWKDMVTQIKLIVALQKIPKRHFLKSTNLTIDQWRQVNTWLINMIAAYTIRRQHIQFANEVWEPGFERRAKVFQASNLSVLRWVSRSFYAERKYFRQMLNTQNPMTVIQAVVDYHAECGKSKGMESMIDDVFGHLNNVSLEDLQAMQQLVEGTLKYHETFLGDPFAIICYNAAVMIPQAVTPEFAQIWETCATLLVKIDAFGYKVTHTPYYTSSALLEQVLQEWSNFQTYQDLSRIRQKVIQEDLGPILAVYDAKPDLDLVKYLEFLWFSQQVQEFYRNPEIRNFTPNVFAEWTLTFKDMDEQAKGYNQDCLRVQQAKRMQELRSNRDTVPLLQQLTRKRHNMGIRQALAEYPAIQQIKPVILASPASVATYLDPNSPQFDLVIFDEASQITPVNAMGSIQRSKQYIIVGDDQQLPPTRFFLAEEDDTEEELPESILSMALGRGIRQQMLRWHYRSQHPDLICVSNAEFYQNQLLLFPTARGEGYGVFFHQNAGIYDRGVSRTNLIEAQEVITAALNHAVATPKQTLGIVTLNQAQRQLLEDILDKQLESRPELLSFFQAESFFIKNLENVQGDESDVIFISMGYGKEASGRLFAQIGPLIQSGGERRLNVLFTRAKDACHIFANFTDEDMAPQASRGWETLRKYIYFARTKKLLTTEFLGERPPQSPFEVDVIAFLEQNGLRCQPQVGSVGYFIDIGVFHPDKPGRFLLGLECDGAQYHSSWAARDRDRIRENVLTRLGWKIYRLWSTHWFTARDKEGKKLLEFIAESQKS